MKYESYENRNGEWGYYYQPEEGNNDIPFEDFKQDSKGQYFRLPYSTWGDYAGDTVNRANYEWFIENYGNNPLVYKLYGGYNSSGIVCHVDILKDETIKEHIEGLDNYPLFHEETHSQLETKLEYESWDSWVKYDLKNALDEAEIEYPDNDKELESLFWHCVRYNDIQFMHEDAVSATIHIEEVVNNWNKGFCSSCGNALDYQGQECENCPSLL
jgi:hypothetical protein